MSGTANKPYTIVFNNRKIKVSDIFRRLNLSSRDYYKFTRDNKLSISVKSIEDYMIYCNWISHRTLCNGIHVLNRDIYLSEKSALLSVLQSVFNEIISNEKHRKQLNNIRDISKKYNVAVKQIEYYMYVYNINCESAVALAIKENRIINKLLPVIHEELDLETVKDTVRKNIMSDDIMIEKLITNDMKYEFKSNKAAIKNIAMEHGVSVDSVVHVLNNGDNKSKQTLNNAVDYYAKRKKDIDKFRETYRDKLRYTFKDKLTDKIVDDVMCKITRIHKKLKDIGKYNELDIRTTDNYIICSYYEPDEKVIDFILKEPLCIKGTTDRITEARKKYNITEFDILEIAVDYPDKTIEDIIDMIVRKRKKNEH